MIDPKKALHALLSKWVVKSVGTRMFKLADFTTAPHS